MLESREATVGLPYIMLFYVKIQGGRGGPPPHFINNAGIRRNYRWNDGRNLSPQVSPLHRGWRNDSMSTPDL
jgi:hypothetical protein